MERSNVDSVAVRVAESRLPAAEAARASLDLSFAGQILLAMLPPAQKNRSTRFLGVST